MNALLLLYPGRCFCLFELRLFGYHIHFNPIGMMSTDKKCLPRSSSCECVTYVIGREIAIKLNYRMFSLTWQASTQIYWNKRKRLHKKGVQLPQDWFGTPTWPLR